MIEKLYEKYKQYPSVQTDTRQLAAGDIFFALKGPSFNGNRFARQALDAGASYVVVDEDPGFSDPHVIKVEDVLAALQLLAGHHRKQFTIPVIGITGSNGKTTTKELLHVVLSKKYKTYTTRGNLNNHIGIPLTLLGIAPDAEMAIVEMGANHLGEIAGYCEYTAPTHGLITNCGKAHLEGFGSIEGVRKGKGELYDYLRQHHGTAFVMRDYDYLREMSRGLKTFSYGTTDADITGYIKSNEPFINVVFKQADGTELLLETRLVGDYNLPNILAAVAVGNFFSVDNSSIRQAIEEYAPSNSRSQLIEKDGNRIILDAYNANPSSMAAAIKNFAGLPEENKALVLGAMMELGRDSLEEHRQLLAQIQQFAWKQVILVGGDFEKTDHPFHFFKTSQEAKEWLRHHVLPDTTYLIKGSRSTRMETIMEAF
ncbi:MAG: UDP-N-acetylmuramoyl-tripeptide--D-alanyl-D-alanine ligase [Chitinophagaceae bacterium]|nr:UDP-N-acetylmuramoyl-tripeptide--D-alanyl-D-alanine ligase [Chitinophagaceae bacterium]MCW5929484.1 UDP-N-acetylmuramoyl-tripeptide--D-alanyl-D-alanine ligase [Chitinophagaceae bacterium]